MVDNLFILPLQQFIYYVALMIAATAWSGARALLLAGYLVQAVTAWLAESLFGPAIGEVAFLSSALIPAFATLAVFLLAISYLLSPFFHIRVVAWQKAVGWLLLGALFFQFAPGLYRDGETLRRALSSDFYQLVLGQANSAPAIAPLAAIQTGQSEVPLAALSNHFGPYIDTDQYVDGLDIAMAFLRAGARDVLQAPNVVPDDFLALYFRPSLPASQSPTFWLSLTADERNQIMGAAVLGIFRIVLGYAIILFGLAEQLIYLALTIAMGVLFVSLSLALPFALFERTELMARAVLDMMLELFIFSAIVAALQAVIVGLVIAGAQTLNPALALGASGIGLVVESVLLVRSLGAIWDSLNRMFAAMSKVVGGRVLSPAEAAALGAQAATGAAGAALTAGAGLALAGGGAAVTLLSGGSKEQAAGALLSGSDALFNTAALGQMALPDGSRLKDSLAGVYEGMLAQRMAPGVGGLLLRQGDEHSATSLPQAATLSTPTSAPAGYQQDIRFDAADIVQLREALAGAMQAALAHMPRGGYGSAEQVLSAVAAHLPGRWQGDPKMDAFLQHKQQAVVSYVMSVPQLGLQEQASRSAATTTTHTTPASVPDGQGATSPTSRGAHLPQVAPPGSPGPHHALAAPPPTHKL